MVLSDNGRLSMVRDVVMVFAEMAAQEERTWTSR